MCGGEVREMKNREVGEVRDGKVGGVKGGNVEKVGEGGGRGKMRGREVWKMRRN